MRFQLASLYEDEIRDTDKAIGLYRDDPGEAARAIRRRCGR